MLALREWLALKEFRNGRRLYHSTIYPRLYYSGKEEYLQSIDNRINPERRNNYYSVQLVLKNTLL